MRSPPCVNRSEPPFSTRMFRPLGPPMNWTLDVTALPIIATLSFVVDTDAKSRGGGRIVNGAGAVLTGIAPWGSAAQWIDGLRPEGICTPQVLLGHTALSTALLSISMLMLLPTVGPGTSSAQHADS